MLAHQPRLLFPPAALAAALIVLALAALAYHRLGRRQVAPADRLAALALAAAPLGVAAAALLLVLRGGRWGHWLLREVPAMPSGGAALAAVAVLLGHMTITLTLAAMAGGPRPHPPSLGAGAAAAGGESRSLRIAGSLTGTWNRAAPWSLALIWLAVALSPSPGGWLLTVVVAGAVLARRVAGERDLLGLLALAVPLGLTAYGLLSNFLAYAIPARAAFGATQLLLVAAGTPLLVWRRRAEPLTWSGPWASRVLVPLTAAGVFWTIGSAALAIDEYDDWWWHRPLVALLAGTGLPARDPYAIDGPLGYHYGFDWLAAAAHTVGGLEPWQAIDLLTMWLAPAVFLLAYYLARGLMAGRGGIDSPHWLPAYLAAFLAVWGGNLRWIGLFDRLWEATPASLWSYLRAVANHMLAPAGNPVTFDTWYRGSSYFSLPENMHHHPTALAWPLALAGLLLWWRLLARPRWAPALLLGAVLGFLALTAAWLLALVVAGAGGYTLVWLRRHPGARPPVLKAVAGGLAVAGALAVAEGGLITDLLFAGYTYQQALPQLRAVPAIPRFGGPPPVAIGSPGSLGWYVQEFGLGLLVAPAAAVALWRWRAPAAALLMPMGVLGLALPHVLEYGATDEDVARLAGGGMVFFHLLNGMALGLALLRCPPGPIRRWAGVGAAGLVVLTVLSPIAFTARWMGLGLVPVPPDTPAADVAAGAWIRQHLPPGRRWLTEAAEPQFVQARLVEHTGHLVPYLVARNAEAAGRRRYAEAGRTLDSRLLADLRLTHVYVTPGLYYTMDGTARAALGDASRFRPLYERRAGPDDPAWRAIYEIRS